MSAFYPLTIASVKNETRSAIAVTFQVPSELKEKFRFVQGQHLTVRAYIGGEEIRRSYSVCCAVQDESLRIGIKQAEGGLFSNWAAANLKPGCILDVMPPLGQFHVPLSAENRKHYLAFAAGSGITPVLSLVKTTLLTEPHSKVTLFYGNRASSTVMFRDDLADLKDAFLNRFTLMHVLSREPQDLELLSGRITGEKCRQLIERFCPIEDVDFVFLCGPQAMMDEVSAALRALGLAKSQIKTELFTVPGARPKIATRRAVETPGSQKCEVTLVLDGGRHVFPLERGKETILEAALRHGIDVRYSCRSGVCTTCRAKLVRGQVDMDANYALEDYEIARGFILTCQSYPATDSVTVDFDQDN